MPWWRSFVFAAVGLRRVWRSERNFRVQAAAGWAALLAGILVRLPVSRLALLLALIAAVLALETLNSALEVVVDLLSPQPHPLAAAAKDLSAGAVLAMSLGALAAGVAIFWPVAAHLRRLVAGVVAYPLPAGGALLVLGCLVAAAASSPPGRRSA